MTNDLLLKQIIAQVPRLLSIIDLDEHSKNYGCVDREYWKYRTKDFINVRHQEACLTFALLYSLKHSSNPYYKDENMKKLSLAIMQFWVRYYDKFKSFDEYYPFEQSHVAYSFSSYAVARSCYILGIKNKNIARVLNSSCEFLNKVSDEVVINHDAGCLPLFYYQYLLTKNKKYLKYISAKKILIKENFDSVEGWFKEYGGPDLGYQSMSIYYLSDYFNLSKDEEILNILKKSLNFFSSMIHPDGSMGGSYFSRETNYFILAGFYYLIPHIDMAKDIFNIIYDNLVTGKLPSPNGFDDRFIAENLYPYIDCVPKKIDKIDLGKYVRTTYYKNCGLLTLKRGNYSYFINVKKGGSIRVFKKSKLLLARDFFMVELNSKNYFSKFTLNFSIPNLNEDLVEFEVESAFIERNESVISPFKTIVVRILSYLKLNNLIKFLARKVLIKNNSTKFSLVQKFKLGSNGAVIESTFPKILNDKKLFSVINANTILTTSHNLYFDSFSIDYNKVSLNKNKYYEEIN